MPGVLTDKNSKLWAKASPLPISNHTLQGVTELVEVET